jgi:hypothetical protein
MDCASGFDWASLWFAVVTGVVAAAFWAFGAYAIQRLRLWLTFRQYAGSYLERRKFPTDPMAERNHLRIEVRRNILAVRFERQHQGRTITGDIVMNPQFPRSGRGQYDDHTDARQLWGFWDVQIKDATTILVHTTYASPEDTAVMQGYIWERSDKP